MKVRYAAGLLAAVLSVGGFGLAQSNEQTRQDTHDQVKQDEKADKAQAKADKSTRKALNSKKVKKAARDQDKANAQADKACAPK
jgi:Flp pilus assembly protein TadB